LRIFIVGELILYFNSKSFPKIRFLNICKILLAIVISLIGYLISPFSIKKPEPPLLKSPVTELKPDPKRSVM